MAMTSDVDALVATDKMIELHALFSSRSVDWPELDQRLGTMFPGERLTWKDSMLSRDQVLCSARLTRSPQWITCRVDGDRVPGISLVYVTTAPGEAARLGSDLAHLMSDHLEVEPDCVMVSDSGSYSWHSGGVEIEISVHGDLALEPHGVTVSLVATPGRKHVG